MECLTLTPSTLVQVESEVEVFTALVAWTEYCVEERKPGLAARLARCVRLGAIEMPHLYLLDAHPLVRNKPALPVLDLRLTVMSWVEAVADCCNPVGNILGQGL